MDRFLVHLFRLAGPVALGTAVLTVGGAAQTRTIWDGIYTEEQAGRGAMLYADRCARCHGDALGGVESAPALTGTTFYANWEGETLEALFERMRSSMPADKPGSLTRPQNADILAHMLKVGGYPAGATALEGGAGALAPITIRMYKP
jgi:S-disulfanyl-L-cysteine oxidoreductase SoxD